MKTYGNFCGSTENRGGTPAGGGGEYSIRFSQIYKKRCPLYGPVRKRVSGKNPPKADLEICTFSVHTPAGPKFGGFLTSI